MEIFNQMMKDFIETQQKTFGYFNEINKIPTMKIGKDYYEMLENNIKFHNAAMNYHKSIVDMMESLRDNTNIFMLNNKSNE